MSRSDEIAAVFNSNYLEYQYLFVEFFTEHLTDISRHFEGDLQSALLLAYVGQVALKHYREGHNAGGSAPGITASRMADVTGIPRPTVRRKLVELEKKGWLVRSGTAWQLAVVNGASQARADLQDVDARSLARIARFVAMIEPMLRR